ncbi:MAG: hypothetical protein V7647_3566 [Acidobacteriota bacterium]
MRRYLIACVLAVPVLTMAQAPATPAAVERQPAEAATAPSLPVRRVILYKTGVGYFEHLGKVRSAQNIAVRFTSAQLNDVLNSLTVLDLGKGQITGISYNSVAPLEQRLGALRLPIGENTTQLQLLASLRGARLEVSAATGTVEGRLLSIERRMHQRDGDTREEDVVSILTDTGELRTYELSPAVRLRIVDRDLRHEVGRYLDTVGSARDRDVRTMVISTTGTGERPLFVSYVSEVPIWKSTYRLVLSAKEKPLLQGWAVVDNTIGEDWHDVELSLVAGAPQSFIQDISQPLYGRRPVVPMPTTMMLSPQTHEASLGDGAGTVSGQPRGVSEEVRVSPDAAASRPAASPRGMPGGTIGGVAGGLPSAPPAPMMGGGAYDQARSLDPRADAAALGDLFEYRIKEPVTLRKNQSALVPILSADIGAERVSLWNRPTGSGRPLRAVWLTNATGLTLDGGSLTVIDAGAFAGEGLLAPLKAGEKRLLSYAADLGVIVDARSQDGPGRLYRVRARAGIITQETEEKVTTTYRARNENATPTTLVIEHRLEPGWKLADGQAPIESTADAQRFRVVLPPAKETVLEVRGVRRGESAISLGTLDALFITQVGKSGLSTTELERALKPLLDKKTESMAIERRLNALQKEAMGIAEDQQRLRENMKALRGTPEEKQLLQRYTRQLDDQETRLDALHTQVTAAAADRERVRAELEALVANLSFDVAAPSGV